MKELFEICALHLEFEVFGLSSILVILGFRIEWGIEFYVFKYLLNIPFRIHRNPAVSQFIETAKQTLKVNNTILIISI